MTIDTSKNVFDISAFKKKKKIADTATPIADLIPGLSDHEITVFLKVCDYLRQVSEPAEALNKVNISIDDKQIRIETRHSFSDVKQLEEEAEMDVRTDMEMVLSATMPFTKDVDGLEFQVEDFQDVLVQVTMNQRVIDSTT